jgi:predicted NAD-dependent protein-ADP-ribosyltransferase YbiA (DUF1768 family)
MFGARFGDEKIPACFQASSMPMVATLMGRPSLHKRSVFKWTRGRTGRMRVMVLFGFENDRPQTDTRIRSRLRKQADCVVEFSNEYRSG